jgi:glyoxylase-like metal-dependent hydrolase (beta-lactamase superfamily II)
MPEFMPDYGGKVNYLTDGQKFKLGGRTIEAFFTPGHTPGSVTFLETGTDRGFCGDAFGTGSGKIQKFKLKDIGLQMLKEQGVEVI